MARIASPDGPSFRLALGQRLTGTMAAMASSRGWLISQANLRRLLGLLWLADGLFLLEPRMLTQGGPILSPIVDGQPALVHHNLAAIARFTAANPSLVAVAAASVQIEIGILLLLGKYIRPILVASIIWSAVVWLAGEGLDGLLTGQAGILTGAPGPVIFYAFLALAVYERRLTAGATPSAWLDRARLVSCVLALWVLGIWFAGEVAGKIFTGRAAALEYVPGTIVAVVTVVLIVFPWRVLGRSNRPVALGRAQLRYLLGVIWICLALLQAQGFWWQPGQIGREIQGQTGQGGLDGIVLDPLIRGIGGAVARGDWTPNLVLFLLCLAIGLLLLLAGWERMRMVLAASIGVALAVWVFGEALGGTLTGATTDFNSGLMLVVLAMACWPLGSTKSDPLTHPIGALNGQGNTLGRRPFELV